MSPFEPQPKASLVPFINHHSEIQRRITMITTSKPTRPLIPLTCALAKRDTESLLTLRDDLKTKLFEAKLEAALQRNP